MVECYAYYGKIDWSFDAVLRYIDSAEMIFELLQIKATHFGYAEHPLMRKGPRMGCARNVRKKVTALYDKDYTLVDLCFFVLPPDYWLQYTEYSVYLGRGKDYMVIAIDTESCKSIPVEAIEEIMQINIDTVWCEHFQIGKNAAFVAYCMNQYKSNPNGENLKENTTTSIYSEELHIVKQYRL